MLLNGKVKVVDKDGSKEVSIQKDQAPTQTCSDEERAKVKELVTAYIKGAQAAPAAPVAEEKKAKKAPTAKKKKGVAG